MNVLYVQFDNICNFTSSKIKKFGHYFISMFLDAQHSHKIFSQCETAKKVSTPQNWILCANTTVPSN